MSQIWPEILQSALFRVFTCLFASCSCGCLLLLCFFLGGGGGGRKDCIRHAKWLHAISIRISSLSSTDNNYLFDLIPFGYTMQS